MTDEQLEKILGTKTCEVPLALTSKARKEISKEVLFTWSNNQINIRCPCYDEFVCNVSDCNVGCRYGGFSGAEISYKEAKKLFYKK